MSTSDTGSETDSVPEAYRKFPEFDLSCAVDEDDTGEVTIFPAEEFGDTCTRWISVDVEHAVRLEHTL